MEQGLRWKSLVIIVAIVVAVAVLYPVSENLYLGLDLQGGMYLVYRVDEDRLPPDLSESEAARQALEIINRRVDQFGVREPDIQLTGRNRIIVALPGISDPGRAKEVIGRMALLEFKLLGEEINTEEVEAGLYPEYEILPHAEEDRGEVVVTAEAELTGKHLENARFQFDQNGQPAVGFSFDSEGAQLFGEITQQNVGRQLAIVLDDKVISAPNIQTAIHGGEGIITGRFTDQEARDLALMLRAGALPAPLEEIEHRTIGPSLGEDSIRSGLYAALAALAAVLIFMAGYYLFAGLIANVTLALTMLFLMAGLAGFEATLTLPGIAGIILTIGMAVDANVIVFERIKEELAEGKPVRTAVNDGFDNAFTAIIDAQVTTIITAIALYWFGTGPIRGFAVTLIMGIISSLFSALFIGKFLFAVFTLRRKIKTLHLGWGNYGGKN
ncbi:MAG: protein translocase subunit SecD [bacterium]